MENNRPWEVKAIEPDLSGRTIQDFIYFEGMYNPLVRFAFTNVLDTEFKSYWNSRPFTVKPHETVKLTHHLAVKFTKELVDKLMFLDKKPESLAIPELRKPYENKVLALLPFEDENQLEIIKGDFLDQIARDTSRPEGEPDAQSPAETISLDFNDMKNRVIVSTSNLQTEPEPVKRVGRPRKV